MILPYKGVTLTVYRARIKGGVRKQDKGDIWHVTLVPDVSRLSSD